MTGLLARPHVQFFALAYRLRMCSLGRTFAVRMCYNSSFLMKRLTRGSPQKMSPRICGPSEYSDQSAHSRSLISSSLDSQGCNISSCKPRNLIRLCGCAGLFWSSLGADVRYVSDVPARWILIINARKTPLCRMGTAYPCNLIQIYSVRQNLL